MKRERRQPTRREWAAITSKHPTVRHIPLPDHYSTSQSPVTVAKLKVTMYYALPCASL
jgi:hypothetical protein